MTDKRQCCESVRYPGNWPRYHACTKPAKVEREGRWFCGVHDPDRVKCATDARSLKWERERATERLLHASVAALREIANGHNDPGALAKSVLDAEPMALPYAWLTARTPR